MRVSLRRARLGVTWARLCPVRGALCSQLSVRRLRGFGILHMICSAWGATTSYRTCSRSDPTAPHLSGFSSWPTALLHGHVEWAHVARLTSPCDLCVVFVRFFSVHRCPSQSKSLVKCWCWTCNALSVGLEVSTDLPLRVTGLNALLFQLRTGLG